MQLPIRCPTEGCLVTSVLMAYCHFSKTYPRKVVSSPSHVAHGIRGERHTMPAGAGGVLCTRLLACPAAVLPGGGGDPGSRSQVPSKRARSRQPRAGAIGAAQGIAPVHRGGHTRGMPPAMRCGCQTRDGYCAGLERGCPCSASKKTRTLVGPVVLAFLASWTTLAGSLNL
jgi:hypothetical protein